MLTFRHAMRDTSLKTRSKLANLCEKTGQYFENSLIFKINGNVSAQRFYSIMNRSIFDDASHNTTHLCGVIDPQTVFAFFIFFIGIRNGK